MPPQQGPRLDQRLTQQGETIRTAQEQVELLALMPIDQPLGVRPAAALAAAGVVAAAVLLVSPTAT